MGAKNSERYSGWRLRMDATARSLVTVPLFAGCTVRQLRRISAAFCPISVPAGRVLVREGEPCDQFFVIVYGELSAYAAGRTMLSLGQGEIAGRTALVANSVQDTTLVAAAPTDLLVASRRELRQIVDVAPSVGAALAEQDPISLQVFPATVLDAEGAA